MPYAPKLTVDQRLAARQWAVFGRNLCDVARRLGVSHQTVRRASRGDKRGVDPGLTGALALLNADGVPELVTDLPVIRDRSLAWIDGAQLQRTLQEAIRGRQCRAVVERVSAMPRQGVASSFCFGAGLGSILATLQTLELSIELVTPAVWKRALGLSADKRASLDKARLLFPTADLRLAKHDGRAEALLLAYWSTTRRATA